MVLLLLALQDAFVSEREALRVREWIEARRWEPLFDAYDAAPDGPLRTYMTLQIAERALEPYRLTAGGTAKAALDRPDEVARRFLLTEAGFEASHRWANVLVDAGRADEAGDVLERVLRYHPDADALTAARLLQLRKDADGFAVAKALAAPLSGSVVVDGKKIELAQYVESLPAPAPARVAPTGPTIAGDGGGYVKIGTRLWKHEFRPPIGAYDELPARYVEGTPAIVECDGATLVVASDGADVVAIEAASGRTWWNVEDDARGEPSGVYRGRPDDTTPPPRTGVTADGDRLFALAGRDIRTRRRVNVWCVRKIVCLDTRTGVGIWNAEPPYEGADWTYSAPPIVEGGRLYSGATAFTDARRETAVVCHDRETGTLLWKRRICRHRDRWEAPLPLVSLALEGDRLVAANNDGEIVALRPQTGVVEWAAAYEHERSFARDPSPPLVHDGNVYVLPQDRPALQVFAFADGAQRRSPTIKRRILREPAGWKPYDAILGLCDGHLVLQGRGQSLIVDLESDRTYDMYNISTLDAGRGAIAGRYMYLPFEDGETRKMAVFEAGSWKYRYSERWTDADEGGSLVVRGPLLVAQGTAVSAYADLEAAQASIKDKPFDLDAVWTAVSLKSDPALEAWYLHLAEHRPSQAARVEKLQRRVRD